jgi:hypothetical protein
MKQTQKYVSAEEENNLTNVFKRIGSGYNKQPAGRGYRQGHEREVKQGTAHILSKVGIRMDYDYSEVWERHSRSYHECPVGKGERMFVVVEGSEQRGVVHGVEQDVAEGRTRKTFLRR